MLLLLLRRLRLMPMLLGLLGPMLLGTKFGASLKKC
jgi:hypothetical protein